MGFSCSRRMLEVMFFRRSTPGSSLSTEYLFRPQTPGQNHRMVRFDKFIEIKEIVTLDDDNAKLWWTPEEIRDMRLTNLVEVRFFIATNYCLVMKSSLVPRGPC